MRISDWSSDVCSSDLREEREVEPRPEPADEEHHFGRDEQDHAVAQVQLDDRGVVAGVRFVDDVRPPAEKGRDHAHEAEAENPLADAAEIVGVHRHDAAEEHHERSDRSEEHTSELQSLMRISYAVFCLKKKN